MHRRLRLTLMTLLIAVGGCSTTPQQPVPFAAGTYVSSQPSHKIGVVMTALPKIDTHLPGASCLFCIAAASVANSALTTHAHTLSYEDLPKIKNDLAELLRMQGLTAIVIPEDLRIDALPKNPAKGANAAKRNFSSLASRYGVDKLLVVDITTLGFLRTYSAYVPTSDPKGVLEGTGYIVDLKTNTYDWYLPVSVTKSADGNWHESPDFPGLTNAYFQAIAQGRDDFLQPFQAR